ncbi:MAG TPA: CDP-alcohol phosphatidyltransferase family protein [Aggregatilineaceae bacterium]|nr:CDP-alcohol phosphatidyltransferase family protein [Aggregatilineaceae bacterium]
MTQQKPRFNTLTDRARYYTGGFTSALGQRVHQIGIHPDTITLVGLLIVAVSAYVIAIGHFFWGGVIMLVGAPLDALDGAVARAMGRQDKFGALFDSTLDRYADGFIFIALAYYFSDRGDQGMMLVSLAALLGSSLVPYVRAHAEGLHYECKIGLLSRMERVAIIFAMLFTGWIEIGVWILAIFSNITAIQRVLYVRRQMQGEKTA